MISKKQYYLFLIIIMILLPLLFVGFQGCGHNDSEEVERPPESIVAARFIEFRGPSPSGVYEMDIEIIQSHDIEGVNNPTKHLVGKTITVLTMEYSMAIKPGEIIAAYVGLYGEKGTTVLYAQNLHPTSIEEK